MTKTETGWLLEKMHDGNVYYISADYVLQWTDDPNKALRLARREDAEALATIVEDCEKIASHEWPGDSPSDFEQLTRLREESLKGVCVYCGEIQQYESLEQKASEEGNALRVAHIKQCAKRPELKLIDAMVELHEAGTKALEWFAGFPHQGEVSNFDRATAQEVYAALSNAINPQRRTGEQS